MSIWPSIVPALVSGVVNMGKEWFAHKKEKNELGRIVELKRLEAEAKVQETIVERQMILSDADSQSVKNNLTTYYDEILETLFWVFLVYSVISPQEVKPALDILSSYPWWLITVYLGLIMARFGLRGVFQPIGELVRKNKR